MSLSADDARRLTDETKVLFAVVSADEAARLAELEEIVHRGLATFVEVGTALTEIRDSGLYRRHQNTFEEYCGAQFGIKRAHAYRLIESAKVVAALSPIGDVPATESQARELVPLLREPEQLRETWAEVIAEHGPEPTAAQVRETVQARQPNPLVPLPEQSEEAIAAAQRDSLIGVLNRALYALQGPPSMAAAEAARLLATGGPGPFTPSRFDRVAAYATAFATALREAGIDG